MIKEYSTIDEISGPLMLVSGLKGVGTGERAEVELKDGSVRSGTVLEINGDSALLQLRGSEGIDLNGSKVRFMGHAPELAVSGDMLGRIFDGEGRPIDGGACLLAEKHIAFGGIPASPDMREGPKEMITTGFSALDAMDPLLRGQRIPMMTFPGIENRAFVSRLARETVSSGDDFAVVFAAIGVSFEEAESFVQDFRRVGILDRTVVFETLSDDPAAAQAEALSTAMTAAEYLAFEKDLQVLFVMTDLTAWCEALREISSARREARGNGFFPRYLRGELASVFERAGRRSGKSGSVTFLPVMTLQDEDFSGTLPEIVNSVSDGRIVLSRGLARKGIYPPVDVIRSCSRLKDSCIGPGRTRGDHADIARGLFLAYSRGVEARGRAASAGDRYCAAFADEFEKSFLNQGRDGSRTMDETLDLGSELLKKLSK